MLKWYELRTSSVELSQKLETLIRDKRLVARRLNSSLFCCLGTEHSDWLAGIVKEYDTTMVPLKLSPNGLRSPRQNEYRAPCGEVFYDPILTATHQRNCPKCRDQNIVVAKIEPGEDFNLDGVISSLEATRNRLASHLEFTTELLSNLKQFKDAKSMMAELDEEVRGRTEAVKLLMRDGKLN